MGIADIINKAPFISRLVSDRVLVKCIPNQLILPFYHAVGNHPMPHIDSLYQVRSIKEFEKDLDYLSLHFDFIELKDLDISTKQGRPKVLLSFDDGFRECYDIIRPILSRKGIPAVFFINTGYVDNKDLMYRCKASYIINNLTKADFFPIKLQEGKYNKYIKGYEVLISELKTLEYRHRDVLDDVIIKFGLPIKSWLRDYQPYMTESMIKELHLDGFTIGAHSHTHPSFRDLSGAEQWSEVEQSVQIINNICNTDSCPFSFPFNDIGVSKSTLFKLDADKHINSTFGVSGFKSDVLSNHVHRVAMEDSSLDAEHRLKSECITHFVRKLIGKQKVKR